MVAFHCSTARRHDVVKVLSESVPLGDLLVRSADEHPDSVAVAFPDELFTYTELLDDAILTARGLMALGVRRGDHVGILMPNSPEFISSYFAISLIGAVIVPINARFRATELGYVIDHARLKVLLSTDRIDDYTDFRANLRDALPSLGAVSGDAELDLVDAPELRRIVMMRGPSRDGFLGEEDFRRGAEGVDPSEVHAARVRVRNRDVAMLLYTSGTTAQPKGCLISHEAISRGSRNRIVESVPLREVGEENRFWCPGPLFHIAPQQTMLIAIALGGRYITATHFVPDEAWRQVVDNGTTQLWPWFQAIMLGLEKAEGYSPSKIPDVQAINLIGPPAFMRRIEEEYPDAALMNGCGMSELAGYYAMSAPGDDKEQRATNGGRPVAGVEVRIVDPETGLDLPPDTVGEILVRGYILMEGYYRDPERTAEAIDAEGWLHTSDLYSQDATGHLTYAGRLKDMLKVGGENVPAIEVEAFLCTHPDVKLAEVVGRPDERLDEVPVAFVELAEGATLTGEELIEFCRGRIATFKVPRAVYFKRTEEWPMSATKINKVALREELARLSVPTPA
jgi:acyl-CoA synthetase (AMP-forming)/AMP-acid ligase II